MGAAVSSVDETRAATLERLRAQIQRVQAAPRQLLLSLATGVPAVDALGVFRLGACVELSGEEGAGRSSLALGVVASACREKRLAAWVDGPAELYPPSAEGRGIDLRRLLMVRPKAPAQLVWAAVQLLRSGAFACVVLDVSHTGVRLSMLEAKKLLDAARAGGSLLVLLTTKAAPAQGLLRLECTSSDAEPRLHVVSGSVQEPPGQALSVRVAHASSTGSGRTVRWARSSVDPCSRATRRAHRLDAPGLQVPQVALPSVSLKRVKKNLRDAPGFYNYAARSSWHGGHPRQGPAEVAPVLFNR